MNRFELWDKVARNWQYRWQQPFRSVVALWAKQTQTDADERLTPMITTTTTIIILF